MLGGSIDIRSQVGQGTEVKIRVPLKRVPGTDTPMSTPSSGHSLEHAYDGSISALRAEYPGKSVVLYEFDPKVGANLQSTNTAQVLKQYIEDWFDLEALSSLTAATVSDLIIVDEKNLVALSQRNRLGIPTIVLSSNTSRLRKSRVAIVGAVEFVSKPFGPYKLAKAIRTCLDKAKESSEGLAPAAPLLRGGSPAESETDTVIPEFEEMTLQTRDAPMTVQVSDMVTAANSTNAYMAIDNSSAGATSDYQSKNSREDFPFPSPDDERTLPTPSERLRIDLTRRDSRRPKLNQRVTEPYIDKSAFPYTSPISKTGEMIADEVESISPELTPPSSAEEKERKDLASSSAVSAPENGQKRPPRLLLVDDNKINLRLLQTYMQKRKYTLVDSAENGQLAVQAAEKHDEGYDIIFMGKKLSLPPRITYLQSPDISMPVMNGFEATRAIRDIEKARGRISKVAMAGDVSKPSPISPALIIALTGLASSRDQSEAFTSGVDLFMTKPMSFKEVGRLLDNWETHGGLTAKDRKHSLARAEGSES